MKPKKTAVEWFAEVVNSAKWKWADVTDRNAIIEQAQELEKEQRDTLLNYIEEVRDLCRKLRFPTEGELRELTDKADVILETFKQQ